MLRMRIGMRAVGIVALALCANHAALAQSTAPHALSAKLRMQRSSPNDIELSGDLAGVPRGETRYLSRDDLLAASQAMTISPDDGNFKAATTVRAVGLEELARALGVPATDMVVADCKDKYQAHYTRKYMADHHPVLVTELNGVSLKESKDDDYGPFMIAHVNFKPAFKILSHSDEPQIPWGVVRLDFRDEKTVLAAIAPRRGFGMDQDIESGFQIARQNCFRCHNSGDEGGQKSGVSWTTLGTVAATSMEFFTDYVRNPKSKNQDAQMPANTEYDQVTLRALFRYFRTFAPDPPEVH